MRVAIVAASFEERCLAMMEDSRAMDLVEHVVLLDFGGYDNVAPYLLHRARLKKEAQDGRRGVTVVSCNIDSPGDMVKRVGDVLSRLGGPAGVRLDCSTLPRSFLFCLCKLMVDQGLTCECFYYRPQNYGGELSRGVCPVRSIPGFEGDPGPGRDLILIVIAGFEGYKALHAVESLGPARVMIMWGDPPYKEEFLERSQAKNDELVKAAGVAYERRCHTHDVMAALGAITEAFDKMRREFPESSLILCPLGTKLQSIAAFAYSYCHRAVSVVYVPSSRYFVGEYSRGWEREPVVVDLNHLVQCSGEEQ